MFGIRRHDEKKMDKAARAATPTAAPTSNSASVDSEPFFSKYRSLLTTEEFGNFHDLISKTRKCCVARYYISSSDGGLRHEEYYFYTYREVQRHREADLSKMEIILVEDLDLRYLMALDATHQLNPHFMLAYVGVGSARSPGFETLTVPANMTGKWYTTEISISLDFPWQLEGSDLRESLNTTDDPWYKALLLKLRDPRPDSESTSPWWEEVARSHDNFRPTVRSKIACYCVSDKLRLVLVESFPRAAQPSGNVIDYKKVRSLETYLHLPIPLQHWDRKPLFSFFMILRKLMRRFGFQHPSLRHVLLSDGPTQPELVEVAKLLDGNLILSPLIEHAWSSSIERLSQHLSQRRSRALMQPSMDTYLPLVDLRRPILGMLDAVSAAIQDVPAFEKAYRRVYPIESPLLRYSLPWSDALQSANAGLHALQRELNDEIHLVIGAVTVQDSDTSKRQAERATLLTLVAAVYLPLTLVTSIFGMNIREIDGDLLTYRACLKALGVVLGCTIVFALAYRE